MAGPDLLNPFLPTLPSIRSFPFQKDEYVRPLSISFLLSLSIPLSVSLTNDSKEMERFVVFCFVSEHTVLKVAKKLRQ